MRRDANAGNVLVDSDLDCAAIERIPLHERRVGGEEAVDEARNARRQRRRWRCAVVHRFGLIIKPPAIMLRPSLNGVVPRLFVEIFQYRCCFRWRDEGVMQREAVGGKSRQVSPPQCDLVRTRQRALVHLSRCGGYFHEVFESVGRSSRSRSVALAAVVSTVCRVASHAPPASPSDHPLTATPLSHVPPEHTAAAEKFYSKGEAARYDDSARMQATQRSLADRALQLLDLPPSIPQFLLDAGCGTRYSGRPLEKAGHSWIGTDISMNMLRNAVQSSAGRPFGPGCVRRPRRGLRLSPRPL